MPARSKAQQRFFGMVRAAQKGKMDNPSPEVQKAASSMSQKDAKKYAETKHKGLPEKLREGLFTSFLENYSAADAQKAGEQLVQNKVNMKPPYKKQPTERKGPLTQSDFGEDTQQMISKARSIGQGRIKGAMDRMKPYIKSPEDEEKYLGPLRKRLQPYQNMTEDQMAAVGLYGGKDHFADLNKMRRTGERPEDPERGRLLDYISENFQGALENIEPSVGGFTERFTNGQNMKEPTLFKRAVSGDFARRLAELKEGDEIEDLGFGSYTNAGNRALDQFFAGDDDNAVISLDEAAKLRDISPITQYNEGEHISMPGTRYRVKSVNPEGHYSRRAGSIPQYQLEMIQDLVDDGKINNSNK